MLYITNYKDKGCAVNNFYSLFIPQSTKVHYLREMSVIKITEGFTYKGRRYAWIKKKLFRLPVKDKYQLSLMEISPKKKDGINYYRCSGDRLSPNQLAGMTEKVNWSITKISSKNTPF